MALIVDQHQPQHKHYCRICKKGFGCGQALGGHMMVHGTIDEISTLDDDDKDQRSYDWTPNPSKRMYSLRTNPNRLKTCRVYENCGTEFSSWKSFLEHGKCPSDEPNSYTRKSYHGLDLKEDLFGESCKHSWSKRKQSCRAKVGSFVNSSCPSSEEVDLAHCLILLSNGRVEPYFVETMDESCAFASKYEGRRRHSNPQNQSYKCPTRYEKANLVIPKGFFECKACKKVFSSHQALGGHRASHKKVKGCFAAKFDHPDETEADQAHGMITQEELCLTKLKYDHNISSMKKKVKVHECSICYRVFSSGQALGGHKRCHWIISKNSLDHAPRSIVKFDNNQFYDQADVAENNSPKDLGTLDLTLDFNYCALDGKPTSNQTLQEIFPLAWVGGKDSEKRKKYTTKGNIEKTSNNETMTKRKFSELNELKEMNLSETSKEWLQVGLGSTSSQAGSDLKFSSYF